MRRMSYAFSLLLIILAESNFNGTGTQVFGTVRYSVLGILVMANADGVRGVSGRNCSTVCCVVSTQTGKLGMKIDE